MSSIAVAEGSELRYQGEVTFDIEVTEKLKGYQYPAVYVEAFQSGSLVYGQMALPTETFVLGGGSSQWVTNGGGPAHCVASLIIRSGLHKDHGESFGVLARVEFEATA